MLRSTFYIALHYLRTTFRGRSVILFSLVMPLAFTLVLGNVIGGGSGDQPTRQPVAVVDEDGSTLSQALVANLQASPGLQVQFLDRDAALQRTKEDSLVATVMIPKGFHEALRQGRRPQVELVTSGTQAMAAQGAEQGLLAAISQLTGVCDAADVASQVATSLGLLPSTAASSPALSEAAVDRSLELWTTAAPVSVSSQPVTRLDSPSAVPVGFDQSSPGMLVTFGLVMVLNGAIVLIVERQQGTLRRLLVMPVPKTSILTGKLAGVLTAGVIQAAVLILAGALLFDVNWGQAPVALALMVLAFSFSITGLGMLIAGVSRTYAQANALANILMYSVAALGGAWWPIEVTPQWMQQAAKLVPSYWAMQGFQDIVVRGLGMPDVLPEAAVLLAFGLSFLAVGVSRFSYE